MAPFVRGFKKSLANCYNLKGSAQSQELHRSVEVLLNCCALFSWAYFRHPQARGVCTSEKRRADLQASLRHEFHELWRPWQPLKLSRHGTRTPTLTFQRMQNEGSKPLKKSLKAISLHTLGSQNFESQGPKPFKEEGSYSTYLWGSRNFPDSPIHLNERMHRKSYQGLL